jgi:hypothetical protein
MKRVLVGVVLGALQGAAAGSTWAEDITVSTYYPSPRGVYEEIRTTSDAGVGTTAASPLPGRLYVVQDGPAGALQVDDQAAPDPTPFRIDQDGNVGIGVPVPDQKLHIDGNVKLLNNRALLARSFDNTLDINVINADATNTVNVGDLNANAIVLSVGAAPAAVQVVSGGGVGIGTAPDPAARLHVNGAVWVTQGGNPAGPLQLFYCGPPACVGAAVGYYSTSSTYAP